MEDKTKCYELYDGEGNLVVTGAAKDICEVLGVSKNYLYNRFSSGRGKAVIKAKGFEVIEVGRYRKVFDACKGYEVVCSGTIDEITRELGISKSFAMYAASPITHERVVNRTKDSKALLLFKHDEMRIEYH